MTEQTSLRIHLSCLEMPSYNPDSIAALTLVRMAQIDCEVRYTAGIEDAPSLFMDSKSYIGINSIRQAIKNKVHIVKTFF